MPNTFNSTVALLVGFLKHLGDVATVLLDLFCLSLFCFFFNDFDLKLFNEIDCSKELICENISNLPYLPTFLLI